MPRISRLKQDKIKEGILLLLFQSSPKSLFTAEISQELARDEEYVKKLLLEMESETMVLSVKKNPDGLDYKRRLRWNLTEKVYNAYKGAQGAQGTRDAQGAGREQPIPPESPIVLPIGAPPKEEESSTTQEVKESKEPAEKQ